MYVCGSSLWFHTSTHTEDEVVEAKEDLEAYAESNGVDIKHYHGENGFLLGLLWMNRFKDMYQGLKNFGVNACNQNGWAECCIWTSMQITNGTVQSKQTCSLMKSIIHPPSSTILLANVLPVHPHLHRCSANLRLIPTQITGNHSSDPCMS